MTTYIILLTAWLNAPIMNNAPNPVTPGQAAVLEWDGDGPFALSLDGAHVAVTSDRTWTFTAAGRHVVEVRRVTCTFNGIGLDHCARFFAYTITAHGAPGPPTNVRILGD